MVPGGSLLRISPIRRAARSLTVMFASIDPVMPALAQGLTDS